MNKISIVKVIARCYLLIAVIGFFVFIRNNVLIATSIFISGTIGSISFFAVASAMKVTVNEINSLKVSINSLKSYIQDLTNNNVDGNIQKSNNTKIPSLEIWKCKKCGTLNKPLTKICCNCSAKNI